MNKASQRTARYDAKNTRRFHLKLNLKTDKKIIEKLESVDSMQGYIKRLTLAAIEKEVSKDDYKTANL